MCVTCECDVLHRPPVLSVECCLYIFLFCPVFLFYEISSRGDRHAAHGTPTVFLFCFAFVVY